MEEVDVKENSIYVTEGCLKASHRAISKTSFNNLDIPFHSSCKEELQIIEPNEITKMTFDLLPISKLFRKGNKIQIRIALADYDNFQAL